MFFNITAELKKIDNSFNPIVYFDDTSTTPTLIYRSSLSMITKINIISSNFFHRHIISDNVWMYEVAAERGREKNNKWFFRSLSQKSGVQIEKKQNENMSIFVWAWTHFCNIAAAFFCSAVCWCHSVYTKHKNPSTENLFDVMILPGKINCCLSSSACIISFYSLLSRISTSSLPMLSRMKITKKYFLNLDSCFFFTFILFCCARCSQKTIFHIKKHSQCLDVLLDFFALVAFQRLLKKFHWKNFFQKSLYWGTFKN